jgi:hypothetical protein
MIPARVVCLVASAMGFVLADVPARAHDGPPFPIVLNRAVGPYDVSVWTDPDSTDDGSPGGQFWVTVRPAGGAPLPSDTSVEIAIRPLDRTGPSRAAGAPPVSGDVSRRFAALLMDHEGRFHVRTTIDGPLGRVDVDAEVTATYDLRPPPVMIVIYLIPFLLVGFLWLKLLLRRAAAPRTSDSTDTPRRG